MEMKEVRNTSAADTATPSEFDQSDQPAFTFHRSFFRRRKNENSGDKHENEKDAVFLGDFFRLRVPSTSTESVLPHGNRVSCIGELQLLWTPNDARTCAVAAVRLYFRPENTPDGRRTDFHGQDEVVALSETAIVQLKNLVQWMVDEDDDESSTINSTTTRNGSDGERESAGKHTDGLNGDDDEAEIEDDSTSAPETQFSDSKVSIAILTYGRYCRYRALQRRLESPGPMNDQVLFRRHSWMRLDVVKALVGLVGLVGFRCNNDYQLLFCRDTFEHHPLLEAHPGFCNSHLVPNFMRKQLPMAMWSKVNKHRSDYGNVDKSSSSTSASNESNEERNESSASSSLSSWLSRTPTKTVISSVAIKARPLNGCAKGAVTSPLYQLREQLFLQRLFDFMRKRNTPIERVPSLGFKQVNLYAFYTHVKKFGGYEKITVNKQWKRIYDKLGGNPGSTSAATTTRRHYERLLLPFERRDRVCRNDFRKEETLRPMQFVSRSNTSNRSSTSSSSTRHFIRNVIDERVKSLSASMEAIEGSNDLSLVTRPLTNPLNASARTHRPPFLASVRFQQQQRKCQQRLKDSRTTEKERMWDEIRRQNALERDRIRQLSAASNRTTMLSDCSRTALKARDLLISSRPVNVVVSLDPAQRPMAMRIARSAESVEKLNAGFLSMTSLPTDDVGAGSTAQIGDGVVFPIVQADRRCTTVAMSRRFCLGSTPTDRSISDGGASLCHTPRMLSMIQRTHALVLMSSASIGKEAVTLPSPAPFAASQSKTSETAADQSDVLCSLSEWQRGRNFSEPITSKSEHLNHPRAVFPVSQLLQKFPRQQFSRSLICSHSWNEATTCQPRAEAVPATQTLLQANDRTTNGNDDNDVLDLTVRP